MISPSLLFCWQLYYIDENVLYLFKTLKKPLIHPFRDSSVALVNRKMSLALPATHAVTLSTK
jgi:hypothetical protein